ncbi:hypothetical protein [Enterovibrio calviensis]|uniref:hypothetical protein n=1 Tax=Enterovibrio calviensis TaxID=91359 RepID=UPI0037352AF2
MSKLLFATLPFLLASCAVATETVKQTDVGNVYVDQSGLTLYTFSKDPNGQSVCNGNCAINWPPLFADEANRSLFDDHAEFSQITRSDGTEQWALNGKPLYRWKNDTQAGDIAGAGIKGVWPIARADDVTLRIYNNGKQRFLVDSDNITLYTFDKDKNGTSNCYGECATKWPPAMVAPALLSKGVNALELTGGYGMTQRNDGTYQWTYNNSPLYRWFKDKQPGDISGNGVKNVWHIVQQ